MAQVARIAPYGWWKRCLAALSLQEDKNTLLTGYFDAKFSVEENYGKVHEYHKSTGRYPDIASENYEMFSFLASLVLVDQRLTPTGQQRLRTSVRDGLQDSKGLTPLATELRTAIHLMQHGYDIQFTDLEGVARFDLLATRGEFQIEVDCKAPSGDVGRKVHSDRFRTLAGRLQPALGKIVDNRHYRLVMVTVPRTLHGDRRYEGSLIREVESAIQCMTPLTVPTHVAEISIEDFQESDIPFGRPHDVTEEELATFLKEKFRLENVNAAFRWAARRGAAILVVKSACPDRVVDGIYRQLKSSAESQFSRRRPAMLCVQLRDISAVQLRNLANASPNGLAMIATRLFSGDQRSHLAGVSFVAYEGALTAKQFEFGDLRRTSYQDVGAAYVFAKPSHSAANEVGAAFGQRGGIH